MLILNKHGATIFEPFKKESPDLKWGIIAPVRRGSDDYEICSFRFKGEPSKYKRGAIVGWKKMKESVKIENYREL